MRRCLSFLGLSLKCSNSCLPSTDVFILDQKPLPMPPTGEEETYYDPRQMAQYPPLDGRNNLPLIRLAQGDPDDYAQPDQYFEYSESMGSETPRLSTITERTERTEYTEDWNSTPGPVPRQTQYSSSTWSSTTDYGQIIGE